jgi:hypothetical protein
VQFLSPPTRRTAEEELRRVEEERAEREGREGEMTSLEPVPTRDVHAEGEAPEPERESSEAVVSLSEQPLLR